MKRHVIVLALLALAVTAFAADFSGGAARVGALGGQKIVVPDISAANDLYAMGFSSGIFAREKKSFVSIIPTLDAYLSEQVDSAATGYTEKIYLFGGGNASALSQYEGAVIWLSKDSVISVKPYLSGMWGKEETFGNDVVNDKSFLSINPHTLGGVVEYGHKLGVVALSGYIAYGKEGSFITHKEEGEEDYFAVGTYYDKLEYALSAAFDAGKDLTFAVNLGNKISPFAEKATNLRGSPVPGVLEDEEELIHNLSGAVFNQVMFTAGIKTVMDVVVTTEGFRTEVGVAVKGTGSDILSGKLGLTTGIKSGGKVKMRGYNTIDGSLVGETENNLTLFEEGIGINAGINGRKDIGGILLGLKCDISRVEANQGASAGKIKTTAYSVSAGAAIGNKTALMIPVELFVNGFDRKYLIVNIDNYSHVYDFGARAGVELMAGDLALRLGADYTAASRYTGNKENGVYTTHSEGAGTRSNPFTMQLGVNAGIGLNLFGAETNLSARFEPVWNQYKNEALKTDSDNVIKLMADMKFYL